MYAYWYWIIFFCENQFNMRPFCRLLITLNVMNFVLFVWNMQVKSHVYISTLYTVYRIFHIQIEWFFLNQRKPNMTKNHIGLQSSIWSIDTYVYHPVWCGEIKRREGVRAREGRESGWKREQKQTRKNRFLSLSIFFIMPVVSSQLCGIDETYTKFSPQSQRKMQGF